MPLALLALGESAVGSTASQKMFTGQRSLRTFTRFFLGRCSEGCFLPRHYSSTTGCASPLRKLPSCQDDDLGIRYCLVSSSIRVVDRHSSSSSIIAAKEKVTSATCDPAVTVWERKDRILYLLGTAHISTSSAELAAQLVRDIQPNAVFVELDLKRFQKLGRSNRLPNMPSEEKIVIPKVPAPPSEDSWPLRLGGSLLAFILRGMYKLAARRGFKPGEEFVLAVKEGQRVGAAVVVGDMDEDVIVRRLAQALLKTDLWKLLTADSESEELMKELRHEGVSSSTEGKTSEEELEEFVEAMKRRDRVRKIASRYQEIAPSLLQVLLTDRDTYMAAGLETLDHYPVVVAVMGMAHLDGVEKNLRSTGWEQVNLPCK